MTEKQIKDELKRLNKEAEALNKQLDEMRRRKTLKCRKCKKRTQVRKLTLIQTYWYTPPYSCTGGDHWNLGEQQYDCPKCGYRNRDFFDKQINALARFFKNKVKEYDK